MILRDQCVVCHVRTRLTLPLQLARHSDASCTRARATRAAGHGHSRNDELVQIACAAGSVSTVPSFVFSCSALLLQSLKDVEKRFGEIFEEISQ
jgi:plasmid stability protein